MNKIDELYKFISKSKKEVIIKKLNNIVSYGEFCDEIIGQGFFGKVFSPNINKKLNFNVNGKTIKVPIAVKEVAYNEDQRSRSFAIINKILYMTFIKDITGELLIHSIIRQLWNKSVHLPLILGYSTCKNFMVDKLIVMKYGLDKPITIDLKNKIFNERVMWNPKERNVEIFKSKLNTLTELFKYIHYSKIKDTVILPNGVKCNISKLYDYICISYLATHELLTKNNIYPCDINPDNIFIHWLNDNSYYGNQCIKNIKTISYKVGNKKYLIKTFGFVIVVGDIGTFIAKSKKDVVIAGHLIDIQNNYKGLNIRLKPEYNASDFIRFTFNYLSMNIFSKTVAFQILNSEPYNNMPHYINHLNGLDKTYLNNLKTPSQLLEYYSKYLDKKDGDIII